MAVRLGYLEDNFVFSRFGGEERDHVKHVSTLLRDVGVTLKLIKCNFCTETSDDLGQGHIISPRPSEIASHTKDADKGLKAARNVRLKLFPGPCKVSRWFVSSFARIASPSTDKLGKGQPFNFKLKEREFEMMKSLQNRLFSLPKLALPYGKGRVPLETDGEDVQVGYIFVYYCKNNLMKRQSRYGIGLVPSQAQNAYTIRRDENASPLYGRYFFIGSTVRLHDLQSEPIKIH